MVRGELITHATYPSNACQLSNFSKNSWARQCASEQLYGYTIGELNLALEKGSNMVYISIRVEIGAGVYINWRLIFGNAHEVGHFVVNPRKECLQLGKGALEAYCSGPRMEQLARVRG